MKNIKKENVGTEIQNEAEEKEVCMMSESDETSSCETKFSSANSECAELSEESSEKEMSVKERVILLIVGIILLLLLIWLGIRIFNGTHRSGIDARSVTDSSVSDSSLPPDENSIVSSGQNEASNGETVTLPKNNNSIGNNNKPTPNESNNVNSSKADNGGGKQNDNESHTDTVNSSDENKESSKPESDEKNDNAAPDYAGDKKVRISEVNDDTGIITVTIDEYKITVPLQTTNFNGRVTKSGVAQGKLFGYNAGVTVLLYYPKADGFGYTEANGYLSMDSEKLTYLADLNGDGTKLLIKINGMKSIF